MGRVLVIGDIHGNHKALIQVLQRSSFDYDKDLLITLGDIVDGLPDTFECVEELLKIKNRIDIKGNHDEWFRGFLLTGIHPVKWEQGGLATAISYGTKILGDKFKYHTQTYPDLYGKWAEYYTTNLVSSDVPVEHLNFFRGQHRYYIDEGNNLFVHAGFNRHFPLREQPTDDIFWWDRDLFFGAMSSNSTNMKFTIKEPLNDIFIGHTATTNWEIDKPITVRTITNLDTGAGFNGKLTIMDVESREYWQSDSVKDLYPDYKGR